MKTLLVGIDGACLPVLERLFERGTGPTIESVCEGGVSAPLESHIPPWTPSAWPTLFTGTNPGKHGVFGFLSFDGYDWTVVNATHVVEPPLWLLLDRHDRTSVVVNVPVTHPPQSFAGALVPGYVGPDTPECHPPGTLSALQDHLGEYRVYPSHTGKTSIATAEKVREYRTLTRMRGEAFSYLADRHDPDLGFVQFQQTDTVVHECPGDIDALARVYDAVDHELYRILNEYDPETVLLVSDHGVGEYTGWTFRANEFLRREGFVETGQGGDGMPSWVPTRDRMLIGESETRSEWALTALSRALANIGLTGQRIEAALRRVGMAEVVRQHVPQGVVRVAAEQVDFPSSRAYCRSRIELGLRINLDGREPDGVVPPEEYETVRRELIERLRDLRTPDGTPVFDEVGPREAYFHGDRTEDAVDIVTVPASFDQFLSAGLGQDVFDAPEEPWNHKRHGVVAAVGDGIDDDVSIAGAHILDIAPTVLAALGIPHGDRMDGAPLPVVDNPGQRTYPEYAPEQRNTIHEDSIETQLEALGYIPE